jgi:hypothetical protein
LEHNVLYAIENPLSMCQKRGGRRVKAKLKRRKEKGVNKGRRKK